LTLTHLACLIEQLLLELVLNSCESTDGRSKHFIYRAVIEVYARI